MPDAEVQAPEAPEQLVSGPIVTQLLDPPPGVPDGCDSRKTKKPRVLPGAGFLTKGNVSISSCRHPAPGLPLACGQAIQARILSSKESRRDSRAIGDPPGPFQAREDSFRHWGGRA